MMFCPALLCLKQNRVLMDRGMQSHDTVYQLVNHQLSVYAWCSGCTWSGNTENSWPDVHNERVVAGWSDFYCKF